MESHTVNSGLFTAIILAGVIVMIEAGWRVGRWWLARQTESARSGLGAVEGAVFGLLGLLLAFTFSGAAARFDARRNLIVEEANAIGTAWLRLDLLPEPARGELQNGFRRYLDDRLATYHQRTDAQAAAAREETAAMQGVIWTQAVAACRSAEGQSATMILLPALNQMFDIASTRTAALQMHPPDAIFILLAVLALASALLAGFAMAGRHARSWLHILGFALIMAATVFFILDLEFPRRGFIRVDRFDQILIDLRQSMR